MMNEFLIIFNWQCAVVSVITVSSLGQGGNNLVLNMGFVFPLDGVAKFQAVCCCFAVR